MALFTTGPGNSFVSALAPTLKISANPETVARLQNQIDFDASAVFRGARTLDDAAAELLGAGARLTEIPSDPWTTARTFDFAARHADQARDFDTAKQHRRIACEYFPLALDELEGERRPPKDELAYASERTAACVADAGEGGLRPPPWSTAPGMAAWSRWAQSTTCQASFSPQMIWTGRAANSASRSLISAV